MAIYAPICPPTHLQQNPLLETQGNWHQGFLGVGKAAATVAAVCSYRHYWSCWARWKRKAFTLLTQGGSNGTLPLHSQHTSGATAHSLGISVLKGLSQIRVIISH